MATLTAWIVGHTDRFAAAVADFLAAEGAGLGDYVDELRDRNPFKGG